MGDDGVTDSIQRIAMLGSHLPRQCGIAAFTTALGEALEQAVPAVDCFVLAMNDAGQQYAYPSRVGFEITEPELVSYRRAADFLNVRRVDVLSVQHEYGIYGGKTGSHLLTLLRELRMPIVTTLHTIVEAPNDRQRHVMEEIVELSSRLVVMTGSDADIVHRVHRVPRERIDVIPYGVPSFPPGDRKDQIGVAGKSVLLTFGLLSPDKGIEHVIDALPAILERHPEAVYIVLGATHPQVKQRAGELYRLGLAARATRLGVDASVIFHDRFVAEVELTEFLSAADIHVLPYLDMEHATSGTLAHAMGSGRAVISTPYRHAAEALAGGRGVLVPRADSEAVAREVSRLLDDGVARRAMGERAAAYTAAQRWPAVARGYLTSFERACADHKQRARTGSRAQPLAARPELPEINFEHLGLLTDHTGVLQHALFNVPSYADGYSLDDNARALLLMALAEETGTSDPRLVRTLASRYLAFVSHAFDPRTRRFRNAMSYTRQLEAGAGSEDCHGRAMWALGTVVGRSSDPGRQSLAGWLFHAGMATVLDFASPRAWAYTLLGLAEYSRAFWGDSQIQSVQLALATRLLDLFRRTSARDWPWFEDRLTQCNARLPQALIATSEWLDNEEMQRVGVRSLDWLLSLQTTADGYFAPIGRDGVNPRGGPRARFDQQPVEAGATVSACLDARRITGDARWLAHARLAFDWFLGQNELHQPLYDAATGGCRDGLHADRVNPNQGAEATLSFLLALFELRSTDRVGTMRRPIGAPPPS